MTVKVKDLAKELSVKSEDIIEQLQKLYVDVDDANSKVDDKIAGLIRIKLGGARKKEPEAPPAEPKKKAKTERKKAVKAKEEKETGPEKKEEKPARKKSAKEEKAVKKKTVKETKAKPAVEKSVKAEAGVAKAGKAVKPKPLGIRIVKKAEEIEKEQKAAKKVEKKVEKKAEKRTVKAPPAPRPDIKRPVQGARPPHYPRRRHRPVKAAPRPGAAKAAAAKKKEAPARPVRATGKKIKVEVQVPANIRALAPKINKKPNELIQYMMGKGAFVNINQDLEEDVVREMLDFFGYELELPRTLEMMEQELVAEHHEEEKAAVETRAPVVTFMGHVDHGKTSLLDYIRKTMVAAGEKGGITQHIGAYKVETSTGSVTFLDTPGHEAFTAMRARGANATDVVVLVVAADDGVMPQTKEAIDHAAAAECPIVVAINKCDLPDANPERVKRELQQEGLMSEDWGGKTVMVEVSAKTGDGMNELVEMLMLESELLELKANPKLRARGIVIESKKTPGKGVVVTLLVQNGTLKPGDIVLCGSFYGRVKAMTNDLGEKVSEALPSTPVEVMGLQGVPEAGEEFFAVKDEKKAKTLAMLKQSESRKKNMAGSQRVSLEDLHSRIMDGTMKELKIIMKADVQGSVGALKQAMEELATKEVKVKIVHSAVGNINESDVMLAVVSNAIVIGFHVKVDPQADEIAKRENVDIHTYDVIYEAIADVKAGMEGLLEPEEQEVFQGRAQVREVFSAKGVKVAGCYIMKGAIHRKDKIKVKRGEEVVFDGNIDNLKRFKDDVKDVKEGFECGIALRGFNDVRKNDILEAYIIQKIARRLEK